MAIMKAHASPAPALNAQPYEDQLPVGPAFAAFVRRRCRELSLNITALARRARVSRSMIYYILGGARRPTLDLAARLCRALGLAVIVVPADRSAPVPKR